LVFFFLKKSIELYFLCKINGPVDWAAARAKISLGFSVISRAGPFVQGVKERKEFSVTVILGNWEIPLRENLFISFSALPDVGRVSGTFQ
jgi:hypothetical protein